MGTVLSKLAVGRVTVIGAGVGVGPPAEAIPLSSKEAVTASVTLFQLGRLILVFMRMRFLLAANSAQNRRETVQQSEFIAFGLHGWNRATLYPNLTPMPRQTPPGSTIS